MFQAGSFVHLRGLRRDNKTDEARVVRFFRFKLRHKIRYVRLRSLRNVDGEERETIPARLLESSGLNGNRNLITRRKKARHSIKTQAPDIKFLSHRFRVSHRTRKKISNIISWHIKVSNSKCYTSPRPRNVSIPI